MGRRTWLLAAAALIVLLFGIFGFSASDHDIEGLAPEADVETSDDG